MSADKKEKPEVHGWILEGDITEAKTTAPPNKNRFGIHNTKDSKTKVIWSLNGKEIDAIDIDNGFEDMVCRPGDKLKVEAVVHGKKAIGTFFFTKAKE